MIATYNVRTLSSYDRLLEFEEAIRNIKYDIIGISEMRRHGNKIEEYKNFIMCYIGQTPGQHGVGFIINKSLKNHIISFNGITERVATLNIKIQEHRITIIQAYAPTEAASELDIEEFYATVEKALSTAQKTIILMGDFNAKLGTPKDDEYLVTKKHGYGERNERGQRLLDFALQHKLMIINTCFKKRKSKRWTWRSPNGQYKNEIDFILSNQHRIFQNIETLSLNYNSDHRIVRSTITLNKQKISRAKFTNSQINKLKSEEEISKFKESLISQLSSPTAGENTTVQYCYDRIERAIIFSLKQTRSMREENRQHKILSARTERLLKRRKELQTTKNKSRSQKNELSALYKVVNKYIKADYKKYRNDTIKEHLQRNGSTKKAYKKLKTNTTWIEGLRKKDTELYTRDDIITTATEFYRHLYSNRDTKSTNLDTETDATPRNNVKSIDETEIIEAIKKLKLDKSPSTDNITNETLKIGHKTLALPLVELFNKILQNSETPSQWSQSNIILIYKKGDPKDIGNYRPISLLPSIYKLFSTIINIRIRDTLEKKQPVEQAGFRRGFSTVDHIHTLELIMEKYQEKQRTLYIAFIDYQKAFDTVIHNSIWESLKEQGVDETYIKIIQSIYKNNKGKIKLETLGPSFSIERGVRHGDPLSPTIFIAVLESVISKLDWSKQGLYINGTYLSHLRFADDLALISESSSQLQNMVETLNQASGKVGLEMNITKTKTMTNSSKRPITINNKPLEYVEDYVYLGKTLSFERKNKNIEIEKRIKLTWNKYWGLKEIFKSDLPQDIKTKVMNSSLLPCLTYGCQTWKFTAETRKKIIVCQRGLERSMLKLRKLDKIRHTKIRKITKATNALSHAKKMKWKWAGHVARLTDQRWTKKVTFWNGPLGKRRKGRPVTRWEDDIKVTAGSNWRKIAEDRDKWASLEEAFTQLGVPED